MSDFIGYESVELQRLPATRSTRESVKGYSKNSPVSDIIYLGSFRRIPKLVFLDDSDTDATKNEMIFSHEIDTARKSYVRITQKRNMANKKKKKETLKEKNASSRSRRISNVAPV